MQTRDKPMLYQTLNNYLSHEEGLIVQLLLQRASLVQNCMASLLCESDSYNLFQVAPIKPLSKRGYTGMVKISQKL